MTRHRLVVLLVGAVLAAVVLTACGNDDDGVQTSTTTRVTTATTDGSTGTTGAGTPSGTVAPDAAGVALDVVFLHGGKVATGHRRVAPTQAVARAALEQLVVGPDATETAAGFTSAVPSTTAVRSVSVTDGLATVDLTPAVTAHDAQAQVVYTLTQFPSVDQVRFGAGGPPLTRADFRDVTPLVFLQSVAPGDQVTSPVKVAGESNTFEGTVRIQVLGADGAVLADTFTTATSGSGTWGTFSANVPFTKGAQTTGKVKVFWDSPKDGSPQDVTEVPVTFSSA